MSWKLFGLLGHPVAHSFSPDLMNALARRHGFRFGYHAFSVPPAGLPVFFQAVRLLPVHGFNVTAPHKRAVISFCEVRSPAVLATGASNCVVNREGKLEAHNTDVAGFLWALRRLQGAEAAERALVLGAGGAARAVVFALEETGFRELAVVSRNSAREQEWRRESPALFERADLRFVPWEPSLLESLVERTELVVQCTPVGTWPDVEQTVPFPFERLHAGHMVFDLVYNPPETAFLQRAGSKEAAVQNGLAMLAAQAAEALRLWGYPVPPEEALETLREVLSARAD